MRYEYVLGVVFFTTSLIINGVAIAACPTADLTDDCFVDIEDFAVLASQWLTNDPCVPDYMVYIPSGSFQMGDSFNEGNLDERPVHTVSLDTFYIGQYEVTNQQYCDFLNSALSQGLISVTSVVYKAGSGTTYPYCYTYASSTYSQINYSGGIFSVRTKYERSMANDPMVMVSWYGAVAYCNWLSQQHGREQCYNLSTWVCDFTKNGFRLPTEAEWERAARGEVSGNRFPWGNTISYSQANYFSSMQPYDLSPIKYEYHPIWGDGGEPYTSPVGFFDGTLKYKSSYNWPDSANSYQTTSGSNDYDLFDMAGNVSEWCNDWYSSSYYNSSPSKNPTGPTTGTLRIVRGGNYGILEGFCRIAYRNYDNINTPTLRKNCLGFRIALNF